MPKITPLSEIKERQYARISGLGLGSCAGCGGGIVAQALARAIDRIGTPRQRVVLIEGITCSGSVTNVLDYSIMWGLHGRALAYATGLKLARPELTVIGIQGDGDCLAIGGNHFIHAARRNIDITTIINNNFIYGRTGGQVGPTTPKGAIATSAPYGAIEPTSDACKIAGATGATFVARGTTYHVVQLIDIIEKGILHHGFSVIEVITQCPQVFGRRNPKIMGKTAPEMMNWMKENAISVDQAKEETPEKLQNKIVIGIMVDKEEPEFGDEYRKVIKKAQEGGIKGD